MKTWIGALFAVAVVACGGGSSGPRDGGEPDGHAPPDGEIAAPDANVPADAGIPDAVFSPDGQPFGDCDPLLQTGCEAGEKCAWVRITPTFGMVGCVTDGTQELTEACVYGENGETTGFDNCLAGSICVGGSCESICGVSPDTCPSTSSCSIYAGIFENSPQQLGACDYLCEPVTQTRILDGAAACGSPDATAPIRGCYGVFDDDFSCTPVPGTVQAAPTSYDQGDIAYGPSAGNAYLNGCAAGFAPLLRAANDANAPTICMAFCTPGPTSVEAPENADGLVGSGHTCADRGATAPGTECRYFWLWEGGAVDPPTHGDGIGFCWDPDNYVGDWDNDSTTADTTFPRCSELPAASQAGLGCAPYVP